MNNSSEWPIRTVDLLELSLDTENVRLRSVEPYESDMLAYLFSSEDALGLAHEIAQDGFFGNDLPIVVRENGKLIVLEGNRRISALRGIANPTSVPRYKNQLVKLRESVGDADLESLQRVRVIEAPDRQSAQPILASLHTRNPKKSWPLDQQAAFYYAQLGPKVTVRELQDRYPSAASKIPRFIRMAEMYDLVRKANLGDPALKDFAESKEFKMSTFERLYASDDFRNLLGLTFEGDGRVRVRGDKREINRILSQVVEDMSNGFLNTRRLGSQKEREFKEYVDSLAPSQKSEASAQMEPEPSTQPSSRTAPSPGRKNSARTLDMAGIQFGLSSPGLERRFLELTRINYSTFPNATMDLLRTVLECALKQYLKEAGDPVPTQGNSRVMLWSALVHAQKHFSSSKGLADVIASLKAPAPQDEVEYTKSSSALNAANHNPDVFFTLVQVRETWEQVKPLMSTLLAGVQAGRAPA